MLVSSYLAPPHSSLSLSLSPSLLRSLSLQEMARTKIHDHDVADMIEFFRFAGLSVNISRHCAEQSVNMDANSPRKLFKYLGKQKLEIRNC